MIKYQQRKQKGIEGKGSHDLFELVTCNHEGHFCVPQYLKGQLTFIKSPIEKMKCYEHVHLSCISATLAVITLQAGQMSLALLLIQICFKLNLKCTDRQTEAKESKGQLVFIVFFLFLFVSLKIEWFFNSSICFELYYLECFSIVGTPLFRLLKVLLSNQLSLKVKIDT